MKSCKRSNKAAPLTGTLYAPPSDSLLKFLCMGQLMNSLLNVTTKDGDENVRERGAPVFLYHTLGPNIMYNIKCLTDWLSVYKHKTPYCQRSTNIDPV